MPRSRRWAGPWIGAAALLGGCSGIQAPLDPAAREAAQILPIFQWMLWVTVPVYIAVVGFLVAAILRRRAPAGHAEERPVRMALAAWIAFIALALLALTLRSYFVDRALAGMPDKGYLHIEVVAYQWWWQVTYKNADGSLAFETANEIHLPAQRPALITLESRDVIHSLWLPNLAGKQDAIPGRTNTLHITPTRPGWYRGQCAEFCGLQHAHMAIDVRIDTPGDFEQWIALQSQAAKPPRTDQQQRGYRYFQQRECAACHQIDGTSAAGHQGPNLTHIGGRRALAAGTLPNTDSNLAAWLADPQHAKPGNAMPAISLSRDDLDALVAYLRSLQ